MNKCMNKYRKNKINKYVNKYSLCTFSRVSVSESGPSPVHADDEDDEGV